MLNFSRRGRRPRRAALHECAGAVIAMKSTKEDFIAPQRRVSAVTGAAKGRILYCARELRESA